MGERREMDTSKNAGNLADTEGIIEVKEANAAAPCCGNTGHDDAGNDGSDLKGFGDFAREIEEDDGIECLEHAVLQMHRRKLHQIPELDFDLPETIGYILEHLEMERKATNSRYGEGSCKVFFPCKSSICAFFDRGTEHTTAIRTDMDALPVSEMTMAPYASQHKGCMHACGHDGHMAMVLQLAQWLSSHFDKLPRSVLLVFQPAEETTGGANDICKSGVFEKYGVDRIFGFHLWPDLPAGQIASRPGALLAACDETTAIFHGKSAHIAKAADGADALEACSRFYLDAYDYIAQREAEEPCLLKFGRMEAGTVRNAIAKGAVIEGSLRTFSVEMRERCKDELPKLAKKRADETGCACDVLFTDGYPPVVNDADLYEKVCETLAEADEKYRRAHGEWADMHPDANRTDGNGDALLGDAAALDADTRPTEGHLKDIVGSMHFCRNAASVVPDPAPALKPVELPEPLLIAEDFAFYQRHLPGVFMLLGTGTGIPLHADTFDFDESVLLQGLRAYKALVMME